MMDQIKQMEENLKGLSTDDFLVIPHKMEIDRIRYVISSYLRIRLQKIEKYAVFLLKRDRAIPDPADRYMTKAEFEFAEQYWKIVKGHFYEEACRHMPSLLHEFEGLDVEIKPNFKSLVTLKVLHPVEGIILGDTPKTLEPDTIYMIPFFKIKHLIEQGIALCI